MLMWSVICIKVYLSLWYIKKNDYLPRKIKKKLFNRKKKLTFFWNLEFAFTYFDDMPKVIQEHLNVH